MVGEPVITIGYGGKNYNVTPSQAEMIFRGRIDPADASKATQNMLSEQKAAIAQGPTSGSGTPQGGTSGGIPGFYEKQLEAGAITERQYNYLKNAWEPRERDIMADQLTMDIQAGKVTPAQAESRYTERFGTYQYNIPKKGYTPPAQASAEELVRMIREGGEAGIQARAEREQRIARQPVELQLPMGRSIMQEQLGQLIEEAKAQGGRYAGYDVLPSGELVTKFDFPKSRVTEAEGRITSPMFSVTSQKDILKQRSADIFIEETNKAAAEGNLLALATKYVGTKLTGTDPFGIKTILATGSDLLSGKFGTSEAEVLKVNKQAMAEISSMYFPTNDLTTPDIWGGSYNYVMNAPSTQLAESILGGYFLGGVLKSSGPIISAIGSRSETLAKTGTALLSHPNILTGAFYGVAGALETGKALTMKNLGFGDIDIGTELSKDVINIMGFGQGFKSGFRTGLPVKYGSIGSEEPILYQGQEVGTINKNLYRGIYLETGSAPARATPLLGKTPEGWALGTPKLSSETINKFYGSLLASPEGYIPMSPLETKFAAKYVMGNYPLKEAERMIYGVKLRSTTFGTSSKYLEENLNFLEEPMKAHGLKDITIKNAEEWIASQKKLVVYGHGAARAQMNLGEVSPKLAKQLGMEADRPIADIDIQIPNSVVKTEELFKILSKTERAGKISIDLTSPGLIVTPKGHLFDIHDFMGSDVSSTPWYNTEYLGYGFGSEGNIKLGNLKLMSLSEQATRKLSSTLTMNEGFFNPVAHRMKDVMDYPAVEKFLIASMGNPIKQAAATNYLNIFAATRAIPSVPDLATSTLFYSSGVLSSPPSVSFNIFSAKMPSMKSPSSARYPQKVTSSPSPSAARSMIRSLMSISPSKSLSRFMSGSPSPSPSKGSSPGSSSPSRSGSRSSPIPSPSSIISSIFSPSPSRSPSRSPSTSPSKSPSKSPSPSPSPSPGSGSFFFPIGFPGWTKPGKKQKKFRKNAELDLIGKYNPSLAALLLDIKVKSRKRGTPGVTGFEAVRPILTD